MNDKPYERSAEGVELLVGVPRNEMHAFLVWWQQTGVKQYVRWSHETVNVR